MSSRSLFLTSQIKLNLSGLSADMNTTDILQAQVRDARKVVFKLEEVRQLRPGLNVVFYMHRIELPN